MPVQRSETQSFAFPAWHGGLPKERTGESEMDEIKERVNLKKSSKQVNAVISKMTTKASLHWAVNMILLLGMLGAGEAAESDASADMGRVGASEFTPGSHTSFAG